MELKEIEEALKKPFEDEYLEHLVDAHVRQATNSDQERFLRNMALVALTSRLSHTIREMAKHAELFSKRKKGGYPGRSEFQRLWSEYSQRFGIDVVNHIACVKSMADVRNQIVHAGGNANVRKPLDEIVWNGGGISFCL